MQGRNIYVGDNTGNESIYGLKCDERKGMLSMALFGPDKNGSQFFTEMIRKSHLNEKHAAFSMVTEAVELIDRELTTNANCLHPLLEVCGKYEDMKRMILQMKSRGDLKLIDKVLEM